MYVVGKNTTFFNMTPDLFEKSVDYGSYSLGDVFGTREWVYK